MKRIVIVAGGSPSDWPDITTYKESETFWIGVDRGSHFLQEKGIAPDIAVGDFDSLSESEFAQVKQVAGQVIQAPAEKDETDTQLALSLAAGLPETCPIILIGGTGGRLDHLLANLWLMLEPRYHELMPRFTIRDKQNTMCFYGPGEDYQVVKESDKRYVGFLCLVPVAELTLRGFKYPLTKADFSLPLSLASNEFLGETGQFSFTSGIIGVVQSKDK